MQTELEQFAKKRLGGSVQGNLYVASDLNSQMSMLKGLVVEDEDVDVDHEEPPCRKKVAAKKKTRGASPLVRSLKKEKATKLSKAVTVIMHVYPAI